VSTTLSLDEALDLARRNNPDYLISEHAASIADWNVREAYGALLPGASVSGSLSWQDAGNTSFGIFNTSDFGLAGSTSYYYSSYNLGLSYRLSGATLFGPSQAKSARRTAESQVDATRASIDMTVTQRYLAVLGAQDGVTLAREELARAQDNVRLAEGRVAVGAGIPLEQRQAEVERGRAQVALLQAENAVETARLNLWETLGVRVDGAELTTRFEVADVDWQLDDLLAIALQSNPELRAGRADVAASGVSVKSARTSYLPSLTLSAGWSGFAREAGNENYLIQQAQNSLQGQQANCELYNQISAGLSQPLPGRPSDCSQYVLTPALEDRIRASNKVFPFDFTKNPMSVSLNISLPVFQGFTRQRQVEQAKVMQADAEQRLRKSELRIRAEVEGGYLNVITNRQAVDLESRNLELANDQLRQARERYRVGASSYLELREAEAVKARADRAYLSAVYAFHDSLSALELAVGRPLRQTSEAR
jgi:outer membrane protein